jgi:Putative DNA-binding domain
VDALIAQFPTVTAVVGEAWMVQAARVFCDTHPPTLAPLILYGEDFPEWVTGPAQDQGLAYLPDLARLDRLWTECHTEVDEQGVSAEDLSRLSPEVFLTHRLMPRAAARWLAFDCTVPTLWRALRQTPDLPAFELEARPEALLLTRPSLEVEYQVITLGACAFLSACLEGRSIAAAAEAALSAQPDLDLQSAFAALVAAGVFSRLEAVTP